MRRGIYIILILEYYSWNLFVDPDIDFQMVLNEISDILGEICWPSILILNLKNYFCEFRILTLKIVSSYFISIEWPKKVLLGHNIKIKPQTPQIIKTKINQKKCDSYNNFKINFLLSNQFQKIDNSSISPLSM